jgi:hypothetical protein
MSHPLSWSKTHSCPQGALHEGWQAPTGPNERPRHHVWCDDTINLDAAHAVNPYAFGHVATRRHHDAFSAFRPWKGRWPSSGLVDFLGVAFDDPRSTYCNWAYGRQRKPYASRAVVCDLLGALQPNAEVQLSWPVVSEEYFEYIDVLASVHEYATEQLQGGRSPSRPYVFVELGAGYGHWRSSTLTDPGGST